ncbi:hypothetical protein EON65_53715 [archaeon]|nr:MAG: hypothetical protein EON65_53715 [archaeon]
MATEKEDKPLLSVQPIQGTDEADGSNISPMNNGATQARLIELLLRQNTALEKELERVNRQLDENSMGIHKKGYLYKFREREIYFAPKWGMRYFVLQGNQLSYYGDDQERRPRRTISLSRCFVKDEGTKKHGQFHVFSIYLEGDEDNTDGSLLIRLSSDNAADASMWIDILDQACHSHEKGESESAQDTLAVKDTSDSSSDLNKPIPLLKQPSLDS